MSEDKQPTDTENHAEEDNLERNDFVHKLCERIMEPLPQAQNANGTIFLDGGYGTGKSFVMTWLKKELKVRNEGTHVVYFDAWRNEDPEDPLTPLLRNFYSEDDHMQKARLSLAALEDFVSINFSVPVPRFIIRPLYALWNWIKRLSRKAFVQMSDKENRAQFMHAIWRWMKSLPSFLSKIAKDNEYRTQFMQDAWNWMKNLPSVWSEIAKDKGFRMRFADYVNALPKGVASGTPKLVVLVDELDRCRPDYALAFLEKIRHLFDVEGVVFVVAADMCAIERMVGLIYNSFSNENYLRKFFDHKEPLPSFHSREFIYKLLEEEEKRLEVGFWHDRCKPNFVFFANLFQLDLRRIINAANELSKAVRKNQGDDQNQKYSLGWLYLHNCFAILAAIRQCDVDDENPTLDEIATYPIGFGRHRAFMKLLSEKAYSLRPSVIKSVYQNSGMEYDDYISLMMKEIPALTLGSTNSSLGMESMSLIKDVISVQDIKEYSERYKEWFEKSCDRGSRTPDFNEFYGFYLNDRTVP